MLAILREIAKMLRCFIHRTFSLRCSDRCPHYPCDYEWRDDQEE